MTDRFRGALLRPITPLLALLLLAGPAWAAPDEAEPEGEPTEAARAEEAPEETRRKRGPFLRPKKRKQQRAAAEAEAEAVGADAEPEAQEPVEGGPDAPAAAPDGGVWEWVERMEGEIPSEAQVQALEEAAEVERAEQALVEEPAAADPSAFYADPAAAVAVSTDPLFLDQVDPSEFDIPVVVNPAVRKWVEYLTGNGRKYYTKWISRSTRYRPMMYEQLAEAGLPADLVYLSMVESGYNAHAYSKADAAGMWQFIPGTARLYKLRLDWWVDDRRDPEASLGAAIEMLGELNEMFDDWLLAMAAYNTGPGRVRRATQRTGSKDFWTLANGGHLHSETTNYVPKIIAAAIIGKHPERYGFTGIEYEPELKYEAVRVDGSVELEVLARCAGTTVKEIKALNPALRRFATPPEGYDVRVPVGTSEAFSVALAKVPKSKRVTVVHHKVRRGETLSAIATRYGVSTSSLSQANNLRNANRIYVGMSLRIPRKGDVRVAAASTPRATDSSPARPSAHTVRRGDTLSGIGARYGVSVDQLKSWNGLRGSTIVVGQQLSLKGSGGTSSGAARMSTYTVRRGDTLSKIAAAHGMSSAELQRANGIRNASHIEVGQKLKVAGGTSSSSSWTTYTVRAGDSLGAIATRHKCTVAELKSWNQLRSTVIHPGQKLKVRAG